MTSSPVAAAGPAGPVGRSVGEVRADLAHCDRDGVPWPEAARRLLADVPALLAEVEAAHRFELAAGVEREALLAELAGMTRYADAQVRGSMRAAQAAAETRERVEAVIARYRDYRGGFDQIRQERADFADVLQAALDGDEELLRVARLRRRSAALAAAADAPQPEPETQR